MSPRGLGYHTIYCLTYSSFVCLFQKYNNYLQNYKNEFLISIFFHDIIYIPSRNDNEEKSIDIFNKFYTEIKSENLNKEKVIEFISNTKHHLLPLNNNSEEINYFMDMDMEIIAEDNWEDYENKIRKEYCYCNDIEYKDKRKQFLQSLLNKDKIFRTKLFYNTYEQKARINLTNIINKLS